jgi:hypothetical protein
VLAAVGIASLQVDLFGLWLLHVLRGLLLKKGRKQKTESRKQKVEGRERAWRFDRWRVFDYDSSLPV